VGLEFVPQEINGVLGMTISSTPPRIVLFGGMESKKTEGEKKGAV